MPKWIWRRFNGSSRKHAWSIDKYGFATIPGACDWTRNRIPISLTPRDATRPYCTACTSKVGTPDGMFGPR